MSIKHETFGGAVEACEVSAQDVAELSSLIMTPVGVYSYVRDRSRTERRLTDLSTALPFYLDKHPTASSHVAKTMRERFAARPEQNPRPALCGVHS